MAWQRHCRRLARNGKPGISRLSPSSNQLPRPARKAGFSTFESRSGRETDCLLEERGFETSVPRHGEVRAALHYSISGGVCGTGSGAALSPATKRLVLFGGRELQHTLGTRCRRAIKS